MDQSDKYKMKRYWLLLTIATVAAANIVVFHYILSGHLSSLTVDLVQTRRYSTTIEPPNNNDVTDSTILSTAASTKVHLSQQKPAADVSINPLEMLSQVKSSVSVKPLEEHLRHLAVSHFPKQHLQLRPSDNRPVKIAGAGVSELPQPIPLMGNYNCSGRFCLEFIVTEEDKTAINLCFGRQAWSGKCHFMNGKFRAPVALASPSGSGNTWVRGLLEQATGICTGAIYCDEALAKGGFNGEFVQSGTVLVVKLHRPFKLGLNVDVAVSKSIQTSTQVRLILSSIHYGISWSS